MAQSITITGSAFSGCPVIATVVADNLSSTPSFHRVKATVTAQLSGNRGVSTTYVFTQPVKEASNVSVDIDVSSALRAVADSFEYTSAPGAVPYIIYSVSAIDEYMIDGEIQQSSSAKNSGNYYALIGKFTDRERLSGNVSITSLSTKPSSMSEAVRIGTDYVYPSNYVFSAINTVPASEPSSAVVNVITTTTNINGKVVYPIAKTADDYEFRFINRRGMMESVCLHSLRQTDVKMSSEDYTISRPETLSAFSRGITVKNSVHEEWKLATDPVDMAWYQWFIHDFLMSKYTWVNITDLSGSSLWIPCRVKMSDTAKGYNRQSHELLSMEFTCILDIDGNPY